MPTRARMTIAGALVGAGLMASGPIPVTAFSSPLRHSPLSQTSTTRHAFFPSGNDGTDDNSSSSSSNSKNPESAATPAGTASTYIPLDSLDQDIITCDPDFPCDDSFNPNNHGQLYIVGIPVLTPFVAFVTFPYLASLYSLVADFLGGNNWVAVDGGAYQAKIIAPAINGLVIPAVALLFATLTSTTISTLRQRQVDVRKAINMEAGELRAIECLLDSLRPGDVQDRCRDYLIQYTSRILAECHPRLGSGNDVINPRRGFDSELNGFTQILNQAYGGVIPGHVADESYNSVARLREQRVNRITALQCVYPSLHYAILGVLALAECVAFMMETDQELLVFLNAFQLKVLWSMLTGTFCACFAVFVDLRAPFSGSYQVSDSVDQLETIKMTLQASRLLSDQKKKQAEAAVGVHGGSNHDETATTSSSDPSPHSSTTPTTTSHTQFYGYAETPSVYRNGVAAPASIDSEAHW